MKKIIISAIIMAFILVSCNQKNKEGETSNTPMMENDTIMSTKETIILENDTIMTKDSKTKLFACPMHPEAQGKLNDKCPKCGMDLTEEVK